MDQFEAAGKGNLEWFRSNTYKVDTQDCGDNTALMWASYKGHTETAIELIRVGASLNTQNDCGATALILASFRGHTETAIELIRAGADLNAQDDCGATALIMASFKGHTETTIELIRAGADLNIQDNDGYTALIVASDKGYKEIVFMLLSLNRAGANPNIRTKSNTTALALASQNIWMPQYKAKKRDLRMIIVALINAGSDVDGAITKIAKAGEMGILRKLISLGADVNVQGPCGETALSSASIAGHADIVNELIKSGAIASIDVLDFNHTPLEWAVMYGHENVVVELVQSGANVNAGYRTALWHACHKGEAQIARYLVSAGANKVFCSHWLKIHTWCNRS